ncbi:hypothetical protein EV356DRAFT_447524 [Viridothelium virens]|uniref:FAD-binding domain-containing protein n=1 Tax=Viridothelium virens TaxID=1048519 RepID=A0A6A6H910_VIRVR|nr:hypothetical protein EV356DRAFT_447524 [Viridothelium virens]
MDRLFTVNGASSTGLPVQKAQHGTVETDLLIVGTGPAGGSLACFLASHGIRGIIIGVTSGCADTPRAHITNPAALECLRDIGLEETCIQNATHGENMRHCRWGYSMAGEEYARIHSWGNDPKRRGDFDAATPCRHVDCPQTQLEPILIRYATLNGWICRWNSKFLSFETLPDGKVMSRIHDEMTGAEYCIRSKYLFGCDGGRSAIMRDLGIPLIKQPGQGLAINVLARVDLTKHIGSRPGNLHWNIQPDIEHPHWGWACIARMIKPWHEWMFIFLPTPGADIDFNPSAADYHKRVQEIVGDPSLPVTILDVSRWYINEIVAEYYSSPPSTPSIFCLGDAVHRHPPINGLGSNTCIQDAFNLAWKVAYVEKGLASPRLLTTYSPERQPVGAGVVARANQGFRDHGPVWDALGVLAPNPAERMASFNELKAATPAGKARRQALRRAVEGTAHEFHALGTEMNQRYDSDAVYTGDEKYPRPKLPEDPVLQHQISTYPGSRLPHAWLNSKEPGLKQISTIDLAGHGAFCLLTGIGGEAWKEAAGTVGAELGVEIRAYTIGWGQDWEDVYFDWERRREIEEEGCVLARPDRFVAWRSMGMVGDCVGKLREVMESICIGTK